MDYTKQNSLSMKAKSRYNSDCSVKGVVKNFIKIKKDASVSKPISSGSSIADKSLVTKIPVVGSIVKRLNQSSMVGAYIAHGMNASKDSCINRKKK